jgi:hypothetical protein
MRHILLFLLLPLFAAGQAVPLSPEAKASVLTCGTSPEIYALFGHTAIRIADPAQSIDIVYNYGAFDFNTPNFALKFAKGDLQYFATSSSFADFLIQYNFEKRSVYEQELFLSAAEKQRLFDRLNATLFSEERFYTYKFIDRNCTNMAVDAINEVLGGPVILKRGDTTATYRDVIHPYFDDHFGLQLGTGILFGTKTDERATRLFLPGELMQSLKTTTRNGKPLAAPARTLMEFKPGNAFNIFDSIYMLIAVLAAVVLANKHWLTLPYLTVIGIVGILFCWAMAFSMHEELRNNYNILLFNPLLIALAVGARGKKWPKILAWACLAFAAAYLPVVAGKAHFWIVLPILLTNVFLIVRHFIMPGFRQKNTQTPA